MMQIPVFRWMPTRSDARRIFGLLLLLTSAMVPYSATGDEQTVEQLWQRGDYQAAADAVAAKYKATATRSSVQWDNQGYEALETWKQRFRDQNQLRVLLDALLRANPEDSQARLERLNLESDPLEAKSAIELEALLQPSDGWPFGGKMGPRNRTRFRDYFDLAYRLMRLYEKQGQVAKLCGMGLKIAHGDPPFRKWWTFSRPDLSYWDDDPAPDIDAGLALVIQYGDAATLAELDTSLPNVPWISARTQLARRLKKSAGPSVQPAVGWANLPKGVSAWVSGDTVPSVASDEKYLYAGMPWGVAVYDHAGRPVTRVALAAAASDIATADGVLWAATPTGVFRIARGTWTVATLPLSARREPVWQSPPLSTDPPQQARPTPLSSQNAFSPQPTAVAWDGRYLWIGAINGVQRFEPSTRNLVVYETSEVPKAPSRFCFDTSYVWCTTRDSCSRYDAQSGTWKEVVRERDHVRFLTLADGIVWGEVQLSEQNGKRPCIVGRDTLEVTPVPIESADPYSTGGHDSFRYRGTWDGMPVFNDYYYDPTTKQLRALPKGVSIRESYWAVLDSPRAMPPLDARFKEAVPERIVRLADGSLVLGLGMARTSDQPVFMDWPNYSTPSENKGGLFLVTPNRRSDCLSSILCSDSLPGDVVTGLVLNRSPHSWICTCRGLAAFDIEKGVLAHFRQGDGLCGDRITGGAVVNDRCYFATGSYNARGGLAVYDARTEVFTSLCRSDGLASNALAGLELRNRTLGIAYDVQPARDSSGGQLQCPPGALDLDTGVVTSGGPAQPVKTNGMPCTVATAAKAAGEQRPMPLLGGFVTCEEKQDGRTYLGGTRGLLVLSADAPSDLSLAVERLEPKVAFSTAEADLRKAESLPIHIASPDDLLAHLKDPNPAVRAYALASIPWLTSQKPVPGRRSAVFIDEPYLPVLLKATEDPDARVRATALYQVLASPDKPEIMPALKRLTQDSDRSIREAAAMELARRGEKVDPELIRSALKDPVDEMAYGATGTMLFKTGSDDVYRCVARNATAEVFAVLLEFPPSVDSYDYRDTVFKDLGNALRQHPEAVPVLLHAPRQDEPGEPVRRFAAQVFGQAGNALLPKLHEALKSDEPLVRSNAAWACGCVSDPASLQRLEEALSYTDKLTLQGVLAGLLAYTGPEAAPLLVQLYVQCDAASQPSRRKVKEAEPFIEINNPAGRGKWIDAYGEMRKLLLPEDIAEGLKYRAPGKAQEFYRRLAAANSAMGQLEAAKMLGECKGDDVTKNVTVLKSLLENGQRQVILTAAVSLVALGDSAGEKPLLDLLQDHDDANLAQVLWEMHRLKDPSILKFAQAPLERIIGDATLQERTRSAAVALLQKP